MHSSIDYLWFMWSHSGSTLSRYSSRPSAQQHFQFSGPPSSWASRRFLNQLICIPLNLWAPYPNCELSHSLQEAHFSCLFTIWAAWRLTYTTRKSWVRIHHGFVQEFVWSLCKFSCSLHVWVGSLRVLWLSPVIQRHADSEVRLTGDFKFS